jgi:hypothetical protein
MSSEERHNLELVTIRNAARELHLSRGFVRRVAEKHGLVIPIGAGSKREHLRVRLVELRTAVLLESRRPSRRSPRTRPQRPSGPLNPLVRC